MGFFLFDWARWVWNLFGGNGAISSMDHTRFLDAKKEEHIDHEAIKDDKLRTRDIGRITYHLIRIEGWLRKIHAEHKEINEAETLLKLLKRLRKAPNLFAERKLMDLIMTIWQRMSAEIPDQGVSKDVSKEKQKITKSLRRLNELVKRDYELVLEEMEILRQHYNLDKKETRQLAA